MQLQSAVSLEPLRKLYAPQRAVLKAWRVQGALLTSSAQAYRLSAVSRLAPFPCGRCGRCSRSVAVVLLWWHVAGNDSCSD